ncbi:MAG: 2-oxoglutarate dehydrogenase E1 component [Pseudomonadota bacterium]
MRDTEFLGAGDPGALETLLRAGDPETAYEAMSEAYRRFGWRAAHTDPLEMTPPEILAELEPERYGLTDLETEPLRRAYCSSIGWQIGHVDRAECRAWLAEQAETLWEAGPAQRQRALDLIASAELFEATFDRRLPGAKTFGLSGCESMIVVLNHLLEHAAASGFDAVFVGGIHRGRSTQMALNFGKPLARLVADAKGVAEVPQDLGASSDSPYHLGWEGEVETSEGPLSVWVAPHPSHLSVVAPVALGKARAAIDAGRSVFPLALHTDAAFAGQGITAELLQISGLAPYSLGGVVHVVLNNQVGFTTGAEDARSARTVADVPRMIGAPILHVNADNPDAVLRVTEVALAYRKAFAADIVIDLIGYRRKGHNEIDDPRFTQPEMYRRIDALPPLSQRYADATGLRPDTGDLSAQLEEAFSGKPPPHGNGLSAPGLARDIEKQMLAPVDTGVDAATLKRLTEHLTFCPASLTLHPKVREFLERRRAAVGTDSGIDWATAEALALASLLDAGTDVRVSGQDAMRGAFTQRHLDLHCQSTGACHSVLSGLKGRASAHNTPLTENAVLAFEYGYSLGVENGLTLWEAQFGDFLNVAQSIFDQFIICGEDRWLARSNLVIALPHGVDGGGPDHATAHPERLLVACAKGNIQVINPTMPANWFHALRRQVLADWRKPLVLLAPKTLLRHPLARSSLGEFTGHFRTVVAEDRPASRLVMSSGKLGVLLEQERERTGADVALVRLEQLYPLDTDGIAAVAARYPEAELVWAQEEPENFGCFQWLDRRLEEATGRRWQLVSRPASPSASAGPKSWDDEHLARVIVSALGLDG